MKWIISVVFFFFSAACMEPGSEAEEVKKCFEGVSGGADSLLVLENEIVRLTIHRHGGALVGFTFRDLPVNPLNWALTVDEMPANNRGGAPFRGHFLCLGRWGSPTEGEIARGVPHNGEPANVWWQDVLLADTSHLTMSVEAPLEQYRVDRQLRLFSGQAIFEVTETFHNIQSSGRFTAVVQHATLGGDFLDSHTVVNSNATRGFNQAMTGEDLEAVAYNWPVGISGVGEDHIDMSTSDHPEGYVTTHIFDDRWGWVTAANPDQGLLIGYLWDVREYPWLHIWHGIRDDEVWAKGLEFATTGLGDNLSPEIRATNTFFGRHHNLFIDAQSSVTKSYICFLMKIPENLVEASHVEKNELGIKLTYMNALGETMIKTTYN